MGPKKINLNLQMHTPYFFFRATIAYSHAKFLPCKMTVTHADLTSKFLIIDFFLLLPNISLDQRTIIFLLIQQNNN